MSTKRPTVSHAAVVARLLAKRPGLSRELVRTALEGATDETGRRALLRTLRRVTKAQGVGAVAERAEMPVQSLSRSLSDRGNPTLKTLTSITGSLGVTLTIIPVKPAKAPPAASRGASRRSKSETISRAGGPPDVVEA